MPQVLLLRKDFKRQKLSRLRHSAFFYFSVDEYVCEDRSGWKRDVCKVVVGTNTALVVETIGKVAVAVVEVFGDISAGTIAGMLLTVSVAFVLLVLLLLELFFVNPPEQPGTWQT